MQTLLIFILIFILFSVDAQTTNDKSISDDKREIKRDLKNQGEQEDYWAEKIFDKEYSKQHFDKYKGNITIVKNTITFSDKTFDIINTSQDLKAVFQADFFILT